MQNNFWTSHHACPRMKFERYTQEDGEWGLVTGISKMRGANGVCRWWKLAAARLPLLGRIEKEV